MLESGSVPIGILPDLQPKKAIFHYQGETHIILYSDGLVESSCSSIDENINELKSNLLKYRHLEYPALFDSIIANAREKIDFSDDVCIVSVAIKPTTA